MSPRLPHPLRSARHAAALIATTSAGTERLGAELDRVAAQLDDIVGRLSQVDQRLAETESRITQQEATDAARVSELRVVMEDHRHEVLEILQLLRDDESWTRRLLWQARETPEYALAFEEEEPLISVAITTYTNTEGLIERSLPSILAQTYERLDIVVVGDAAAPEVEKAVMAIGNARVRYANLTHRGPYPDDFEHLWMVAGGPPCNEAARLSRGRWIVHADDDDSSTPDRVEVLLRDARGSGSSSSATAGSESTTPTGPTICSVSSLHGSRPSRSRARSCTRDFASWHRSSAMRSSTPLATGPESD